jgi:hypothetical protein
MNKVYHMVPKHKGILVLLRLFVHAPVFCLGFVILEYMTRTGKGVDRTEGENERMREGEKERRACVRHKNSGVSWHPAAGIE